MTLDLKTTVRKQALDTLDWIDYRPDPHWWQYLVAPGAVLAATFIVPTGALVLLLAGTALLAVLVALLLVAGTLLLIAIRALRDLASAQVNFPAVKRLAVLSILKLDS